MNFDTIPDQLKAYPNWVCGKADKVPVDPKTGKNAMANIPGTWGTFKQALSFLEDHKNNGIRTLGFEVGETPFVGVDLDHCRNPETGEIDPWATEIISTLGTYTEPSPSGTGIRMFVTGEIPENNRKAGNVEMAQSGKYFSVTGNHLEGTPGWIAHNPEELLKVYNQYFQKKVQEEKAPQPKTTGTLEDEALLEKIFASANGTKIRKLFEGDYSEYPSQSEADQALCNHFAFWTGKDPEQIDRLFRQSALYREKWDKRHFGDGRTYGEETIRKAIDATSESYKGAQTDLHDKAPFYMEETETPEQGNKGFHFLSAHDLCVTPKPTAWLLKSYIDAGSLSMMFGEAGSMKTFLAIDAGLCIASDHEWHGHDVRQKGAVFYIAGEGHAGLNPRLKGWGIYHGVDLRDVPFFVSDRPAQFLDAVSAAEVVQSVDELCKMHGSPSLVIVDTLNRNFGPGDENSTSDMTRFISVIDVALRSRFRCAVLIVHHSGLSATERARGASALRAALDWEYRLQKNADGTRILTCTKAKDHAEPPAICFMPETITLDGWIDPDDGEVMTSCVLRETERTTADTKRLSGARKVAFDALVNIGQESTHIDMWRDAAYTAGVSPTSSQDAKRKAFKRAVSELRDAGLVVANGDYWTRADTGQ